MKKLYTTLALAAAVALSASAADVKGSAVANQYGLANMEASEIAAPMTAIRKAPLAKAKPAKVEDVYGYYTLNFGSMYTSGTTLEYTTTALVITAGEKANTVSIDGFGGSMPVEGVFDPATGILSIAAHQVVAPSVSGVPNYNGPAYFDHLIADRDGNSISNMRYINDPLLASFDENGSLVFDQSAANIAEGFNCRAGETNYGIAGGFIYDTSRMQAPAQEGWSNVGKATFTDGWFLPGVAKLGMSQDPGFPAFDVDLQRNKENPNLFRLYDPYKGLNKMTNEDLGIMPGTEYYFEMNESVLAGCIEFDITDPTCVLVTPDVYSGIYTDMFGLKMFFMNNAAGDFVLTPSEYTQDMSTEEKIELWKLVLEEGGESNTLSVYNKDANTVIINDAQFKATGAPSDVNWTTLAEYFKEAYPEDFSYVQLPINMTSVIVLPSDATGIDNIITDNTNKTLEYFNLQGVRVENPSNGIYIRRQGNDVQKVYVR